MPKSSRKISRKNRNEIVKRKGVNAHRTRAFDFTKLDIYKKRGFRNETP